MRSRRALVVILLVAGGCGTTGQEVRKPEVYGLAAQDEAGATSPTEGSGEAPATEATEATEVGRAVAAEAHSAEAPSASAVAPAAPEPAAAVEGGGKAEQCRTKAIQAWKAGDKGAAADGWQCVVSSQGATAHDYYDYGVVLEALGRHEDAAKRYEEAIAEDSDFYPAARNLARMLVRRYGERRAEDMVSAILQRHQGCAPLRVEVARILLRRGQYDRAVRELKALLKEREGYPPAILVLAEGYFVQKKYELAQMVLDNLEKLHPDLPEIYYWKALISLQMGDEKTIVLMHYRKALSVWPGFPEANNNIGVLLMEAGDFDAAREHFQRAIESAPGFLEAMVNLGNVYRALGDRAKAMDWYRKVVERFPDYAPVHLNLGILYLESPETKEKKISALNAALEELHIYQRMMGPKLTRDDVSAKYVDEAKKLIEVERQRIASEKEALKAAQEEQAAQEQAAPEEEAQGGSDTAGAQPADVASGQPDAGAQGAPGQVVEAGGGEAAEAGVKEEQGAAQADHGIETSLDDQAPGQAVEAGGGDAAAPGAPEEAAEAPDDAPAEAEPAQEEGEGGFKPY